MAPATDARAWAPHGPVETARVAARLRGAGPADADPADPVSMAGAALADPVAPDSLDGGSDAPRCAPCCAA